jgi:hypothetical protein
MGGKLYPRARFEAALKNGGPIVQELVEETIDRLGARGHLEFRDLLSRGSLLRLPESANGLNDDFRPVFH